MSKSKKRHGQNVMKLTYGNSRGKQNKTSPPPPRREILKVTPADRKSTEQPRMHGKRGATAHTPTFPKIRDREHRLIRRMQQQNVGWRAVGESERIDIPFPWR